MVTIISTVAAYIFRHYKPIEHTRRASGEEEVHYCIVYNIYSRHFEPIDSSGYAIYRK